MFINIEYQPKSSMSLGSPSECKFKLAEKLYIPSWESNKNWYSKEYVEELQNFYQNERESLKTRIDRIYKENDDSKIRLLTQIEELKNLLKNNSEKHKEEIILLNTEQSEKLARVTCEKDSLITQTRNEVYELKNELSQITLKYSDLKGDHKRAKFEAETQIDNLSQQLKNQGEIFDSTRGDFEYRIKTMKERYEYDRDGLKKEYEKLIESSR